MSFEAFLKGGEGGCVLDVIGEGIVKCRGSKAEGSGSESVKFDSGNSK